MPLQTKEVTHLIQCGALDGLGESRAALLVQAEEIQRAGSANQMAFGFVQSPAVPAEPAAQRLAWEMRVLEMPVSVHPLELVAGQLGEILPLSQLPHMFNQRVTIAGARLPGWTGGKGVFIGDGQNFVIIRGAGKLPVWQTIRATGRYCRDEWGGTWFQAEQVSPI